MDLGRSSYNKTSPTHMESDDTAAVIGDADTKEGYLQSLIIYDPNDVQAHTQLAELYAAEGKLEESVVVYEKILAMGHQSKKILLDASAICVRISETAESVQNTSQYAGKAIQLIQRLRIWNRGNYSNVALDILTDAYNAVVSRENTLLNPALVSEVMITASVKETMSRSYLHILLLRAILLTRDHKSAMTYVSSKRLCFSYDLRWLAFVRDTYDDIRAGLSDEDCSPLELLEQHLFIGARAALCSIHQNGSGYSNDVQEDIAALHALVEESDSDLPSGHNSKQAKKQWVKLRLEYVSQDLRCDIESALKSFQDASVKLTDLSSHRAMLQKLYNDVKLSISYCPEPPVAYSSCDRVSALSHILLPMLETIEFRLPSVEFVSQENHGVRGLINPDLVNDADKTVFIEDPWDFKRILNIASWHLSEGSIRKWLREVFPRLAENPQYTSRPTRFPRPTIADIEGYLLFCLTCRFIHARHFGAVSSTKEVLFATEILNIWRPSTRQIALWWTLLVKFGKSYPQQPYFSTTSSTLNDGDYYQAIHELRGLVRAPYSDRGSSTVARTRQTLDDHSRKVVFGLMGLTYARMTTSTLVGHSAAVDRTAEAAHYLRMSFEWENVKTMDAYQNVDSVLFVVYDESDRLVESHELQHVESTLTKMQQLLQARRENTEPRRIVPTPERLPNKRNTLYASYMKDTVLAAEPPARKPIVLEMSQSIESSKSATSHNHIATNADLSAVAMPEIAGFIDVPPPTTSLLEEMRTGQGEAGVRTISPSPEETSNAANPRTMSRFSRQLHQLESLKKGELLKKRFVPVRTKAVESERNPFLDSDSFLSDTAAELTGQGPELAWDGHDKVDDTFTGASMDDEVDELDTFSEQLEREAFSRLERQFAKLEALRSK
ncbi:hypothetical protein SeMB42_g05530 [Synchytrium endobioticum]|uniref:Uncharacterized protein n=1 Tax=Synchytrium endobioticum TaxID=286115 RepID=A0A507CQV5_9FUNG|nr:hypothetical protein SeMB42_g05530 [Synchytrium endobioticum]